MRGHFFPALPVLIAMAAGSALADPAKEFVLSHLTGTVRDSSGGPIAGAKVHLSNAEGPYATRGGNWAFAGADGKYSLRVFVKPENKVVVTEVILSAKGFAQMRERSRLEEVVLQPGKDTTVNFVLAGGEVEEHGGTQFATHLIVTLPKDAAGRTETFSVAKKAEQLTQTDPISDVGQKYLLFSLD
jgi:Carboxypeptidase regulatory-like domain